MVTEQQHEHKWVPTHAALLGADYPNFVVRYGCEDEHCDVERIDIEEGQEI